MFVIYNKKKKLHITCAKMDSFDIKSFHYTEQPFIFKDDKSASEVIKLLDKRNYAKESELEVQCLK